MRKGISVSTLLGHAHVEMALACLGSLLRYSADPLRLRIHDDGSLTGEDRDRLAAGLGEPQFVGREEADARVEPILAGRSSLVAFRGRNPLALKLIDIPAFAGDELAYCDSDVLFLRPFTGLFAFPGTEAGALFMSDRQNAYSVRSWHLARHPRLRLSRKVNSGVLLFRTRFFDPDLLEWYFGHPEFQFAPVWAEQTAWALLGWQAGCRLWDPRLIRLPERSETGEAVALHFVSPLRNLLAPMLAAATDRSGEAAVAVGSERARKCGVLNLARTEAERCLRRLAGR